MLTTWSSHRHIILYRVKLLTRHLAIDHFAAYNAVIAISAGAFGTVSVDWFVDLTLTTALRGTDYIADGATLTFQPHETLKGFNDCCIV